MSALLFAQFLHYVFGILMFLTAVFLILLILVQRGRGGGLAGALGGMGGQSAFGTKAGDLFTRITIICAVVWIVLCVGAVKALSTSSSGPFKASTVKNPPGEIESADDGRSPTSEDDSNRPSDLPNSGSEPAPKTDPVTEPSQDEPKKDEPKKDEPKKEEPKAEEKKADEPKKEEPKADEKKADAKKADEKKPE
ncbi:MAG: preprotein translocase subunit SecG [Planctomycetota bacterium]